MRLAEAVYDERELEGEVVVEGSIIVRLLCGINLDIIFSAGRIWYQGIW